ncbi:hypothetical protein FVE85_6733 [Porphyridium purpureum]|uniref:Uncharacterized protein n=1 Tax=Porphyridium purpureum TaxID=35688 RepID=A0A5J4Z7F5_PORPP|nr:hypothetical protein FVE85_6733 [Porphyridium purpureum]|eukprot:POR6097..scf295_1
MEIRPTVFFVLWSRVCVKERGRGEEREKKKVKSGRCRDAGVEGIDEMYARGAHLTAGAQVAHGHARAHAHGRRAGPRRCRRASLPQDGPGPPGLGDRAAINASGGAGFSAKTAMSMLEVGRMDIKPGGDALRRRLPSRPASPTRQALAPNSRDVRMVDPRKVAAQGPNSIRPGAIPSSFAQKAALPPYALEKAATSADLLVPRKHAPRPGSRGGLGVQDVDSLFKPKARKEIPNQPLPNLDEVLARRPGTPRRPPARPMPDVMSLGVQRGGRVLPKDAVSALPLEMTSSPAAGGMASRLREVAQERDDSHGSQFAEGRRKALEESIARLKRMPSGAAPPNAKMREAMKSLGSAMAAVNAAPRLPQGAADPFRSQGRQTVLGRRQGKAPGFEPSNVRAESKSRFVVDEKSAGKQLEPDALESLEVDIAADDLAVEASPTEYLDRWMRKRREAREISLAEEREALVLEYEKQGDRRAERIAEPRRRSRRRRGDGDDLDRMDGDREQGRRAVSRLDLKDAEMAAKEDFAAEVQESITMGEDKYMASWEKTAAKKRAREEKRKAKAAATAQKDVDLLDANLRIDMEAVMQAVPKDHWAFRHLQMVMDEMSRSSMTLQQKNTFLLQSLNLLNQLAEQAEAERVRAIHEQE